MFLLHILEKRNLNSFRPPHLDAHDYYLSIYLHVGKLAHTHTYGHLKHSGGIKV